MTTGSGIMEWHRGKGGQFSGVTEETEGGRIMKWHRMTKGRKR